MRRGIAGDGRRSPVRLDECDRHAAGAGRRPGESLELFVVEGESAALAVSRVRDIATQAVLPMQGKPLNAAKATARRVAAQPFFRALVAALGAGPASAAGFGLHHGMHQGRNPRMHVGLDDARDITGLRYDRLLLLMDPDADGIHCGVLLLTFLHRWVRPLLDAGRVEIVRPPWGEVLPADGGPVRRAWSEKEFASLVDRERERGEVVARRFRGLAALDPVLLRESCVSPASRRTEPVDAARAAAMIDLFSGLDDT